MCKVCEKSLNVYIDNGSPICVDCGYFLFLDHYEGEELNLINKKIDEWCEENDYIYDTFEEYIEDDE